ncbi:MAG TPA: hypothetical protein VMF06_03365 [Candidatus Limnocylindria bacterium]|nr:hypothetical protein [Candidatus Limnocylindria bacterium]
MKRLHFSLLLLGLITLQNMIRAEVISSNSLAKLAPIAPFPALAVAAASNGIPLDGLDPLKGQRGLNSGDTVSVLVALVEKSGRRTQWLIALEAVAPEAKDKPASPSKPMVLYSSLGNRLEFESVPGWAKVRTLGPFLDTPKGKSAAPKDLGARIRLDQGHLSLGLDRAAAAALLLKASAIKGHLSYQHHPFSEDEVNQGKKLVSQLKFTADDERAICGTGPALLSYFEIIQQTQGLNDILLKILELPSVWSMMRHGGVKSVNFLFDRSGISSANPIDWGLPKDTPIYYLPMVLELDGHPGLNLTFVVTSPRPPLLACGGIVGVLAERPDDKRMYLSLRVVAAHLAVPGR